jgi:hypothetical protein
MAGQNVGGGGGGGGGGGNQIPPPVIFAKVAARYAPLALPAVLHDLPENYMKSLPKFTGEGDLTAQEHINFFDQFADILGIEHEDVYSRLLVQTFEGQVRTWFRSLPAGSLGSYQELENAFIRQWGERKDHLYYLTEFGALKKKNSESVLEFTQRFNKLYNKIPAEVKPSQPAAKVTYAGAFDPDFALLLRERRSVDLPKMQDDAVEIESNMMASGKLKAKTENVNKENKKFKEQAGPSGSGKSAGDRIDEMARVIQQLSNKISKMELEKPRRDNFPRKDFRKNPEPQGQHKTIKNEDQKVQAPFKTEDYIGEEDFGGFEQLDEDIDCLGDDNRYPYVSRQDYEASLMKENKSEDVVTINATDDHAYQSVADDIIADLQGRYNLRSRSKNLPNAPVKKVLPRNDTNEENPKVADKQSANRNKTDNPVQSEPVNIQTPVNIPNPVKEKKVAPQQKNEKKIMEAPQIENEKAIGNFNLENEISKIKIPIPLVELAKNPVYRKQIAKMINFSEKESQADSINLEDDRPIISFGPHVEGPKDTVAPFYITLTVFDHLLHNCMLDSGASHNVMPKAIMDKLGLEVTRPYGDLYSFDSRRVKCIGMIKDLVVNLAQIPSKSILMDVVVADIPPKYGMLLSRSWGAKLGGSIQLDMTYATIPVFGGQFTRLYRETRMAFTVSDPKNPTNHPVYIADQDLGNCILSLDDDFDTDVDNKDIEEKVQKNEIKENVYSTGTWKMFFDGASSYLGAGAGVLLIALTINL